MASIPSKNPQKIRKSKTLQKSPKLQNPGESATTEPPAKKQRLFVPPPPIVGDRPIYAMRLFWDGVQELPITVLLDCGSEVPIISDRFVMRHGVPKVERDAPIPIRDVAERIITGSGKAFTYPLRLSYDEHLSEDTYEIGPMEEDIDVILPFWWMAKHPCPGFVEGNLSFSHPKCANCTEEGLRKNITFEMD
jgi:hypothetical protein